MNAFLVAPIKPSRLPLGVHKGKCTRHRNVRALLRSGFARVRRAVAERQRDIAAQAIARPPTPFWRGSGAGRALLLLGGHLVTGAFIVARLEGWTLLEGIYFAVAVATTVGYGDLAPSRPAARAFVAVYALISVGIIGKLLARVVDAAATAAAAGPRVSGRKELVAGLVAAEGRAQRRALATAALLLLACLLGAVVYGRVLQTMSAIDILYFVAVTASTVGLGDLHPISGIGRAFAAVWLVIASLGFANLVARFAEWRGIRAQRLATEKVLSGKFSEQAYDAMDENGDGSLAESEFLGYVLCKMGKTSPEEVRGIMARFKDIDEDGSGFITRGEVELADS